MTMAKFKARLLHIFILMVILWPTYTTWTRLHFSTLLCRNQVLLNIVHLGRKQLKGHKLDEVQLIHIQFKFFGPNLIAHIQPCDAGATSNSHPPSGSRVHGSRTHKDRFSPCTC